MAKKKTRTISKERRQYPRVPTEILLDVRPPVPGSPEPEGGLVVNLSLGGLAFESQTRLKPGTEIYVAMERPLALTGRIVHVFPNGNRTRYGVRFTSLELYNERKLERLVSLIMKKT